MPLPNLLGILTPLLGTLPVSDLKGIWLFHKCLLPAQQPKESSPPREMATSSWQAHHHIPNMAMTTLEQQFLQPQRAGQQQQTALAKSRHCLPACFWKCTYISLISILKNSMLCPPLNTEEREGCYHTCSSWGTASLLGSWWGHPTPHGHNYGTQ